jgi:hypothetical protein
MKVIEKDAVGIQSLEWKVRDAMMICQWLTSLSDEIMNDMNKHPEMVQILEAARKFVNPPFERIDSVEITQ